jgi:purine-binding chemotaxis protein CheW
MATSSKYLTFTLNEEFYGISISKVREVIRYAKITPIHESNRFLKGVINLRGRIIPVIDMRLKFGMEPKPYTDRTVFIIVEVLGDYQTFLLGIAVDAVSDVVDISDEDLEKTPQIGLKLKSYYLYGIAQIGDHMIMILNIDKILSSDEIIDMSQIEALQKESRSAEAGEEQREQIKEEK